MRGQAGSRRRVRALCIVPDGTVHVRIAGPAMREVTVVYMPSIGSGLSAPRSASLADLVLGTPYLVLDQIPPLPTLSGHMETGASGFTASQSPSASRFSSLRRSRARAGESAGWRTYRSGTCTSLKSLPLNPRPSEPPPCTVHGMRRAMLRQAEDAPPACRANARKEDWLRRFLADALSGSAGNTREGKPGWPRAD